MNIPQLHRRALLKAIPGGLAALLLPLPATAIPRRTIVLQQSPLAGFQFYRGEQLFPRLRIGMPLQLVREAHNRHDPRAVAVHVLGEKIGFVPRADNAAIAQMLDRGERLSARIIELQTTRNPWQRVKFEVVIDG